MGLTGDADSTPLVDHFARWAPSPVLAQAACYRATISAGQSWLVVGRALSSHNQSSPRRLIPRPRQDGPFDLPRLPCVAGTALD